MKSEVRSPSLTDVADVTALTGGTDPTSLYGTGLTASTDLLTSVYDTKDYHNQYTTAHQYYNT